MSPTDPEHAPSSLAASPLILLAEDDNTSRHYLTGALGELGCDVESCADGGRALVLAGIHRFDLLLLDHRMPVAGAGEVLGRLRSDLHARSRDTVAVATSAEVPRSLRRQLLEQGFAAVLEKPVAVRTLQQVLLDTLPPRQLDAILHDGTALARSGNEDTMRALRALFVTELQRLLAELEHLADDRQALEDRLHQLRAACGFCGAEALAQQAVRLRMRVGRGDAVDARALQPFRLTVQATLAALAERD